MKSRLGAFSFARHSPFFYDGVHATDAPSLADMEEEQRILWLRKCRRTMTHEVLHMFGMNHCIFYSCLMVGSNGPEDTAGHERLLCPVCTRKFLFSMEPMGINIDEQYAAMAATIVKADPEEAARLETRRKNYAENLSLVQALDAPPSANTGSKDSLPPLKPGSAGPKPGSAGACCPPAVGDKYNACVPCVPKAPQVPKGSQRPASVGPGARRVEAPRWR
jgi:hypothetical protein